MKIIADENIVYNLSKRYNYTSDLSGVSLYMKEIQKYPILTQKEEKELAQEIANGNKLAREKFIHANLRLVVHVAKRYSISESDFLDLIQEGNLGLFKAVDMFDPTKQIKFSTYATYWIKRSILLGMSKKELIRIPSNVQELVRKYELIRRMSYDNNRRVTDYEICKELNIPVEKIEEIKSYMYNMVSLNARLSSESDTEIKQWIKDSGKTPEELYCEKSRREVLNEIINKLSDIEKEVIKNRYDLENDNCSSRPAIAKKLGISKERVRSVEKRALEKLRKFARPLEELLL